jgi:hypothetical protein
MVERGSQLAALAAWFVLTVAMAAAPAWADATQQAPSLPPLGPTDQGDANCWHQFMEATGVRIACSLPAFIEDADRDKIRKLTRDVLTDARCLVAIDIERSLVDAAVKTPDNVFVVPPQQVACEIDTSRGKLPIAFTFAPRIEIKGGVALKATPGMDHVTGVNSWLAWPVVAYINASGAVQDVMLRVVNAYLKRRHEQVAR